MKICLCTLNSKFTHTSLALRWLKGYLGDVDAIVEIKEYTINTPLYPIIGDLHRTSADLYLFSSYIWNGDYCLQIAETLKALNKTVLIGFGGPEVSFNAEEVLQKNPAVDFVLRGEGEAIVKSLVDILNHKGSLSTCPGLTWRSDFGIVSNTEPEPIDLDALPFPYEDLTAVKDRILYYESSRGCPYNCSYCLSSATKGIRFRRLDLVTSDLERFIEAGVRQVKFIDRTFNANPSRALELWKIMARLDDGQINFHFEITAELLREEDIHFLNQVRVGLFQFEIGVQTTMLEASEAVNRRLAFDKLKEPVVALQKPSNIHIHLDLIAGLPYEGYHRFLQSFDEVYALKPQVLQLGFLKLIKGSTLKQHEVAYGYVHEAFAPYEVLESRWMNFTDMLKLKDMEEVVEQIHNSKRLKLSLQYLLNLYAKPSELFIGFATFLRDSGKLDEAMSTDRWVMSWLDFGRATLKNSEEKASFHHRVMLDYLAAFAKVPPEWLIKGLALPDGKAEAFEIVKSEQFEQYFDHLRELAPKERIKKMRFIGLNPFSAQLIKGIIDESDLCHNLLSDWSSLNGESLKSMANAVLMVNSGSKHAVLDRHALYLFIQR